MGYTRIPKIARNKYDYVGLNDGDYTTMSAIFKATGGGGSGGGTVINNTTISAINKIVQQYADEKGFVTPDDVKTVNGYSLIGYGDIEVTADGVVDLSAYVTKVELENAGYLTTVPSNYATKAYVQEEINKIPQADLSSYVQDAQLMTILSSYVTKTDLEQAGYLTTVPDNYATKTYVASKAQELISSGSYITSNDVSNMGYVTTSEISQASYVTSNALETELQDYATKTYVQSEISKIPQAEIDLSSYVTKTELEQAGYLTTVPDNYATKTYVETKISEIPQPDLSSYVQDAQLMTILSSYVTKTELEQAGYLTTVPDNYATKAYVSTKAQEMIASGSYISSNELSGMGYVTTSEISQASYVTSNALDTKLASYMKKSDMTSYVSKTELNHASYVPQSQLTEASYATSVAVEESLGKYVQLTYLDEKLENVVTTSTYTYTGTYYTAKDTDGVIVLKGANTTLTFPTEGITEGKMITVINKTGSSFQAASNGGLINKESSTQQQQQRISYMVSQYIYIEGSWYVL